MKTDRLAQRLGETLVDDEARGRFLSAVRKWLGRLVLAAVIGYAAFLVVLAAAFGLIGEKNLTLAFALYLPRVVFLLPLAVLLPAALLFRWRSVFPLLLAALIFFSQGMGWRFRLHGAARPTASQPPRTLNVMTYNRGQNRNQSLQPFKNATHPDIVALQEAPRRAQRYAGAEGYEEFVHTRDAGQFTLLSRFPIVSATLLELPDGDQPMQPAARFVIDFEGTRIAVYSIHLRTPRDTLLHYRNGAFLYGILGLPGTPFVEKRKANQVFWDRRIVQARQLLQKIENDPLPVIVAGDFNAPSGGYIHGIFDRKLRDAHQEAGAGFGYTFPGITRNPLSFGGPWMRIDYLYGTDRWNIEWCVTEPNRQSQHRALTAQFRLTPGG